MTWRHIQHMFTLVYTINTITCPKTPWLPGGMPPNCIEIKASGIPYWKRCQLRLWCPLIWSDPGVTTLGIRVRDNQEAIPKWGNCPLYTCSSNCTSCKHFAIPFFEPKKKSNNSSFGGCTKTVIIAIWSLQKNSNNNVLGSPTKTVIMVARG